MVKRETNFSRRSFLAGTASVGALAAFGLAGCAPQATDRKKADASEASAPKSDWLGSAPEIDETQVVKTYDADVIVVGTGTAGLFAACSAVEQGVSCIALDKATKEITGNGIRDTFAGIGSKQQLADGENPNKFDVINELVRQSNGFGDDRLYRLWADLSGETMDWYADRLSEKGMAFQHEIDDHTNTTRFKSWEVGHSIQWGDMKSNKQHASSILTEYGLSKGLECHYETTMKCLIKEEGRITGVYAENAEGIVRYNAKNGVIVCTGGYASNPEMMEALQPESELLCCIRKSFPTCEGDGIKACL